MAEFEGSRGNFKTQLCKYWEENQFCKKEDKCPYAHGASELRTSAGGPGGPGGKDRERMPYQGGYSKPAGGSFGGGNFGGGNFVKGNCKFFMQGSCKFGAECKFRHPNGPGPSGDNGGEEGMKNWRTDFRRPGDNDNMEDEGQ